MKFAIKMKFAINQLNKSSDQFDMEASSKVLRHDQFGMAALFNDKHKTHPKHVNKRRQICLPHIGRWSFFERRDGRPPSARWEEDGPSPGRTGGLGLSRTRSFKGWLGRLDVNSDSLYQLVTGNRAKGLYQLDSKSISSSLRLNLIYVVVSKQIKSCLIFFKKI